MSIIEEKASRPTAPRPEPERVDGPNAATPEAVPLVALSALASAVLVACGGGSGETDSRLGAQAVGSRSAGAGTGTAVPPLSAAEAARFLQQAQFSSNAAEIEQVRAIGMAPWLAQQMAAPLGPTGWQWLMDQGYNREDIIFDSQYSDFMAWNQLITAPDAVRKRVALAWSEILVVSASGLDGESPSFAMAAYWDVLNTHAFGNFRQLLEAITLNPAMGAYLNTRGNQKEDLVTGRQPDENYAREVMQLFTIGLYRLHPDGSIQRDGSGRPMETYGPSDVSNLARVFTGYDLDETGHARATYPVAFRNPMTLRERLHSRLEMEFLGARIAANTPGAEALRLALDTLFNHPNVGPFIGHQLIQRLVTSAPSPQYVARVAAAFADNGAGVRGDLRAVTAAVLLDPEARQGTAHQAPTWGKLREPVVRCVQWARTFGAVSSDGGWRMHDWSDPSTALGQSPLRSPSVFNFFRPGYVPPNTALALGGQTAPEFQITNETSVAGYINFMENAIAFGIYGSSTSKLWVPSYDAELALSGDPPALLARLNLLLAAGALSQATLDLIAQAIASIYSTGANTDWGSQARVWSAILMVMACPEYLVQK